MRSLLLIAAASAVAAGAKLQGAPKFNLASFRSSDASPQISVSFADGHTDTLVLERYAPFTQHNGCSFVGHLASEPDNSGVAFTGCGDVFDVTLLSEHSEGTMFSVDSAGNAQQLKHPLAEEGLTDIAMVLSDDGTPVPMPARDDGAPVPMPNGDDGVPPPRPDVAAACSSFCQATFTMSTYYDTTFRDEAGGEAAAVTKIVAIHAAAKILWEHSTLLGMTMVKIDDPTDPIYLAQSLEASGNSLDTFRSTAAGAPGDFVHLFTDYSNNGIVGIAWVNQPCAGTGLNSGITTSYGSTATIASTLAHELGHNQGLGHNSARGSLSDRDIMDPSVNGNHVWSTSSAATLCTNINNRRDCYDVVDSCSGSTTEASSTSSFPSSTSSFETTTTGCDASLNENCMCDEVNNNAACNWDEGECCEDDSNVDDGSCNSDLLTHGCLFDGDDCCAASGGRRSWISDKYCDDENNTPECQYDGGDCCFHQKWYWDYYCTDCECINLCINA